jgi:cob(I)alamin adenosyltransferase
MGITSGNGDDGTTEILFGERLSKGDLRIEALGTLDELNSFLGLARALSAIEDTRRVLLTVQRRLFGIGAELAVPKGKQALSDSRIAEEDVRWVENTQAPIEEALDLAPEFAVPGENAGSAALDIARAVTRRLERVLVRLTESGAIDSPVMLAFVNRLADLLFILARKEERG